MKLESFKQLTVWQRAVEMAKEIYQVTEKFPSSELYGLTSQMRRAAISIPSNIAEGYKRKNIKEYIQFLSMADASAAELETQIIIAKEIYGRVDFAKSKALLEEIQKMLITLIKKLNPKPSTLNPRSGFTLAELVVAMGIFLVAIVITVGSFARTLKTQRLVNHLMSVNSNSSIVLEQIAREMRSGFEFQVRGSAACTTDGQFDEVEFTNDKSNKVFYHMEDGAIKRKECPGSGCTTETFAALTSPDTTVTRFCFIMNNPTQSPRTDPWRITTVLTIGSVRPDLSTNYINLETTIAARVIPKDLLP